MKKLLAVAVFAGLLASSAFAVAHLDPASPVSSSIERPGSSEMAMLGGGDRLPLGALLGLGLLGVIKVPVRKSGDAVEHWSGDVRPEEAAGVVNAVCDGKFWHLYRAGDELHAEHTEAHLHRNADKPGKVEKAEKKKSSK